MKGRKRDTYHWVIGAEGEDPMIALWEGRMWTFPECTYGEIRQERRVFRVGIGGGLNKPPSRWVPDIKAEPLVYAPDLGMSDMVQRERDNCREAADLPEGKLVYD